LKSKAAVAAVDSVAAVGSVVEDSGVDSAEAEMGAVEDSGVEEVVDSEEECCVMYQ